MLKLLCICCICLTTFPAFCQPASKYKVGTITEVEIHRISEGGAADVVSYDVSIKVGDTIYVVLYAPPMGDTTVKYIAGRDLLVLVGQNAIRYNDMLGNSLEVPIESKKPAANPRSPKFPTAAQ